LLRSTHDMGCGASKSELSEKEKPKEAKAVEEQPKPRPSYSVEGDIEPWVPPLLEEASRIFQAADRDHDGRLNIDELIGLTGFEAMAKRLLGKWDSDLTGDITLDEWTEYIKSKGEEGGPKTLQLYENALKARKGEACDAPEMHHLIPRVEGGIELWWPPLSEEATRVFVLCDADKDGMLDVAELTALTGFKAMAERIVGKSDVDLSGNITLDEWLDYIKSKGEDGGKKAVQLYDNALKAKIEEANKPLPSLTEESEAVTE